LAKNLEKRLLDQKGRFFETAQTPFQNAPPSAGLFFGFAAPLARPLFGFFLIFFHLL